MTKNQKALIGYVIIFFVLVVIWYLSIYPLIQKLEGKQAVLFILAWFIGKTMIWILPVFIYFRFVGIHNPLEYLKIRNNWVGGTGWGIGLSIIWVALRVILFCFIFGDKTVSFQIGIFAWVSTLVAGLYEEISFRGLILQELNSQIPFWKANILSTILFLVYHFPAWSVAGFTNLLPNCVLIALLGLIWGYVFTKTKSIWPSTIFHILHNLSIKFGIGG